MIKSLKKILITLFASYCAALIFFAVFSFLSVPGLRTGLFRGEWIIGNTLVLFIRYLIPIHIAAILFAFSLFGEEPELGRKSGDRPSFPRIVNYSLVFFLLLTPAYMVLLEGILPAGLRMRDQAVVKTGVVAELKKKAENALNQEKYTEARYYIEHYLTINPGDLVYREKLEKVVSREKSFAMAPKNREEEISERSLPTHMTFRDFLEKAKERFDGEDYITAQYYADLALKLDSAHPEPKRIIAESRNRIMRMDLSGEERETIRYFAQKREGYDMLSRNEFVAAYYHFLNLLELRPSDPDLGKYIAAANEGLKKVSFFVDEVAMFSDLPIFGDILFLNRAEGDEREFLYFKRMIRSFNPVLDRLARETSVEALSKQDEKSGIWDRILRLFGSEKSVTRPGGSSDSIINYYAVDIEGIRISKDGTVRYQFKAPYGKFLDGILVMRCLDRGDARGEMVPDYLIGEAPDESPYHLKIRSAPADILQVALGKTGFDGAGVRSLYSYGETYPLFGLDNRPVYLAFFNRLFMPFSFVVLSVFAMGLGKRLRSRYLARPPAACFLFLPVLPFLTSLVFQVYRYGGSIFTEFFLLSRGFSTAVALFLVFQGFLLLLSLLYLAGQVNR
jgi:hypothetical protein